MGKNFFESKGKNKAKNNSVKRDLSGRKDSFGEKFLDGFGGSDNINEISSSSNIIRVNVYDERLIDKEKIKETNANGILSKGNRIQVIYGNKMENIVDDLKRYLAEISIPIASSNEKLVKVMERYDELVDNVFAPVAGEVVKLTRVEDGVFSAGMMGKGIAIIPMDNRIFAPVDGIVSTIFDSKHAICFKSNKGVEVMVQIGVDTVTLNGKYFEILVKKNQEVSAGELIGYFNAEAIRKIGYRLISSVVITNYEKYGRLSYSLTGIVTSKNIIIEVKDKLDRNINRNLR